MERQKYEQIAIQHRFNHVSVFF